MAKFNYPTNVDLSETVTDERGNALPRYWGQKREDGQLIDSATGRFIYPKQEQLQLPLSDWRSNMPVQPDQKELQREFDDPVL
jgi:hypothetical protein